ncbi:NUDIX domain-containing protein [Nonomuraea polychroma]|nr:NUDIX domain-containing protein [Nonomuraea polychroma]
MPIPRAVAVVVDGARVLIIKRFLRLGSSEACPMCQAYGERGPMCLGHHYAVLPGGHVEEGEAAGAAARRELYEETTLEGRVDRLLWKGRHNRRPASYFLMADVTGTPVLSGEEAAEHGPDNSFELMWVTAKEFDALNLHPADIREPLAALLRHGDRPS